MHCLSAYVLCTQIPVVQRLMSSASVAAYQPAQGSAVQSAFQLALHQYAKGFDHQVIYYPAGVETDRTWQHLLLHLLPGGRGVSQQQAQGRSDTLALY